MDDRVNTVLEFWIGDADTDVEAAKRRGKLWYQSTPESDEELRALFGDLLNEAETGQLEDWRESAEGTLALVILLDQFSRNLYRGKAGAFANDTKALEIATALIDKGSDRSLSYIGRAFLYHPFEHSEDMKAQERSVELFSSLSSSAEESWQEYLESFLDYAKEHRDVVKKFGRFPHRNKVLGRESTPEEQAYLDGGAKRYGQ